MWCPSQVAHPATNQSWDSGPCYQKFVHPGKAHQVGESHNQFTCQILGPLDQQFVCKCMETALQIRGQEMAEIQRNMIKSSSGLGRPISSLVQNQIW